LRSKIRNIDPNRYYERPRAVNSNAATYSTEMTSYAQLLEFVEI